MVKEAIIEEFLEGVNAEEAFGAIFAEAVFTEEFHAQANGCVDAEVDEWAPADGEGGELVRRCAYRIPLDAPAVVRKLAGSETVPVTELQRLEVTADDVAAQGEGGPDGAGNPGGRANGGEGGRANRRPALSFVVRSQPRPQIPGGDKFRTETEFSIRGVAAAAAEDGGVERRSGAASPPLRRARLVVSARCTASGPYGLTGVIERTMVESASKNMAMVVMACRLAVQRAIDDPAIMKRSREATLHVLAIAAEARETAAAGRPPQPPPAAVEESASSAGDYVEAPSELPLPPLPPKGQPVDANSAVLYLHYIARTGDEAVGLLASIDSRLRGVEAQLERDARARARMGRWADTSLGVAIAAAAVSLVFAVHRAVGNGVSQT